MASQIHTPDLSATTPPFFNLDVGHSAKVISDGNAVWVKVIDIRDEDYLGIVTSNPSGYPPPELREHDVIEFKRENIFGMF